MKKVVILFGLLFKLGFAQELEPLPNPYLADSPWPIYHGNSARQSHSIYTGPTKEDWVEVKLLKGIKGGTSPWTYFTEKYPNGQRALLQSNATHFYKILDTKNGPRIVSKLKIDKDWLTSFGWNFLQTKGNVWYTYDPKYNPAKNQYTRLFKVEDKNEKDPYSSLVIKDTFNFSTMGKVQHFGVNYSGQIVFASDNDKGKLDCTIGVLSNQFELLDTLKIPSIGNNEIFGHNAFPIDDNNSFYIVSSKRLIRFDWDGKELAIGFEVPYDSVGDGPTGRWAEGSGTTPTLMGFGEGNDQLVVMADGHKKNNLLAFWREVPEDWTPIKGQHIHFAGKIQLPATKRFSKKFQSIENSPTVYGYDVAIAQFNGFLGQGKKPLKGVQKVRWNTEANRFQLSWVNTDINMNGVLTYSLGSNLVYGSGREDGCNYYYYGLDWNTGELKFRKFLGRSCKKLFNPYDDGGNQHIIDEDGSIYFSGGGSLVKLETQ
ncbi:MAG: hypothetical protein AAGC45_08350 [Bacteroidota bacterium]